MADRPLDRDGGRDLTGERHPQRRGGRPQIADIGIELARERCRSRVKAPARANGHFAAGHGEAVEAHDAAAVALGGAGNRDRPAGQRIHGGNPGIEVCDRAVDLGEHAIPALLLRCYVERQLAADLVSDKAGERAKLGDGHADAAVDRAPVIGDLAAPGDIDPGAARGEIGQLDEAAIGFGAGRQRPAQIAAEIARHRFGQDEAAQLPIRLDHETRRRVGRLRAPRDRRLRLCPRRSRAGDTERLAAGFDPHARPVFLARYRGAQLRRAAHLLRRQDRSPR